MNTGNILKLKTENLENVDYHLPIGDDLIHLNPLIGKRLSLEFTGAINCLDTGKKIKKSYGQGYSFESFLTLPQCDRCIFQPELCHFHEGTCRDDEWGLKHCFQPHIIYLANSSTLKVGITRKTQVPTRWMDQGASFALPICEVKDRRTSGLIEVELAKKLGDKTNWRKMLKNDLDELDLIKIKKGVLEDYAELFKKYEAKILEDNLYTFNYPVEQYPEKVKSYNLDKNPLIEDKLMGIKGQYLIFEGGVINIRKYQGYELNLKTL
jgi:hypothetical protein